MSVVAVVLLVAAGLAVVRRWWWITAHTPGELVRMQDYWPWNAWPLNTRRFRPLLSLVWRHWHHRLMRRHVQGTTFIGNTFGGVRQKRDFWTCGCGFVFSWEPTE